MQVRTHLSEEPLVDGQLLGPWPSVEHQVHVRNPSEKISRRQVPQQVVNGVVEPSVYKYGRHDQDVGQDDEDTRRQSKADHNVVLRTPDVRNRLMRVVVEEYY